MTKRLYKSKDNKVLAGICGGVGEYFDVDPVMIRLLYLVITIATGILPGMLVYLVAMTIVPDAPLTATAKPVEPEPAHDSKQV